MTTATATLSDSITLRYTHTMNEQLHACRVYQRSTRKHLFYKFIGIVAVFSGAWLTFAAGLQPTALLLFGLGVFTWFDPVPLLMVWSTFRGSASLRQPFDAVFDQRGARFQFGKERVNRPWERYTSFVESPQVFVLIYGRWAYSVVPKRAFADPQAIDAFRALLRAKIGR